MELYLEDLEFNEQVRHFAKSSVFIVISGQGAANTVFLPKGSVVILSLAPRTYGMKWM